VPAARPRVSKWGTYYPKTYANWLKVAKEQLKRVRGGDVRPGPNGLVVALRFLIERARTSKLVIPTGDIDNYAKGALDVLTHNKVWTDDALVTKLVAEKRFTLPGETPGVEIEITNKE